VSSRLPIVLVLLFFLNCLDHAFAQSPAASPAPTPARVVPYPIDLPETFAEAIEKGTRTANGRPGAAHWTNTARYQLEIEVDPVAAQVSGRASMTYVNRSPDSLDRLLVHVYQDLLRPGAMRTRSVRTTTGFEVRSVSLGGEKARYRVRDTVMLVRLQPPLASGEEVTLDVEYAFPVPPAGTAPRMGHEDEDVFYLGYWYPQFAVYDDVKGWVADPYRGNGEFYMGYADYDVAITAPQGYLVQATGELQNPDDVLTQKQRDALARALQTRDIVHVVDEADLEGGGATAKSPTGKLTWRFRAENVRDVAVSIARTYLWDTTHAVVKDKDGSGRDGVARIHALYEPKSGRWDRAAEYARHPIEFMSQHLYPYPWPHMTACEGIIGGGMEYPMMTICGGRQPAGVIAHELVHMWFPMLVGSNEKRCAWQDEGFTTFWTTFVRDDFTHGENGPQRENLTYGNAVLRGHDVVCMRHADTYGEDDFGFASYTKPAAILHQLRAMLGDERFFAAFRRYTSDWAWKHPYPYDFFRTFSDVAGEDLEPYFRTWFYEAWRLEHAIAGVSTVDGRTTVSIEDRGRALHPTVVGLTFADGEEERRTIGVDHWRQHTNATLSFDREVVEVQIDPDLTSLDCNRRNNHWKRSGD
jgi:hypothetical protein